MLICGIMRQRQVNKEVAEDIVYKLIMQEPDPLDDFLKSLDEVTNSEELCITCLNN